MISIHPFTPANRMSLISLMAELQEHLATIDPLKRIKTIPDFDAEAYINHLLEQMKGKGVILIANDGNTVVGFIAGTIPGEDSEDALDHYPAKEGKIVELVVSQIHRGQGTGKLLMEKIEEYFRDNGCEYIRVGCFAQNTGTHAFYKKCGYGDRYIEMLKELS